MINMAMKEKRCTLITRIKQITRISEKDFLGLKIKESLFAEYGIIRKDLYLNRVVVIFQSIVN